MRDLDSTCGCALSSDILIKNNSEQGILMTVWLRGYRVRYNFFMFCASLTPRILFILVFNASFRRTPPLTSSGVQCVLFSAFVIMK